MTLQQQTQWLFRINAIMNWMLSLRGMVDPKGMAVLFGGPVPNYPFLVRFWSGMVFMFGCMFWETSRNVVKKSALIKYNWIEKTVTALAVTIGYVSGDVPGRLLLLIFLTNWLWIPMILYYDIGLRRESTVE